MRKIAAKAKKTTRKTNKPILIMQPLFVQRVVVVSTCLVLVVGAVAFFNRHQVSRAVAGTSIARGLFMQATVALPTDPQAVSYNVYYKEFSEDEFSNAARNIPANLGSYTISYLKKDAAYVYRIAKVDKQGREYSFSDPAPLNNLQPM